MADNENSKRLESMAWTTKFLSKQAPMSYAQLETFIKTWCHVGDGVVPPWDPTCNAAMCPVLVSEAGEGKSKILQNYARSHGLDWTRVPIADAAGEDNRGVVTRQLDEQGNHQFTMPAWMPMRPPKSATGHGICFFDEITTGDTEHQNIIATMLTDGYLNGLYGHKVAPGWFFFAATNPDELKYRSNELMDARLHDRLFPIYLKPTDEEVLHTLVRMNKLPNTLHGMLRMNIAQVGAVSPRSWELIGALWFRYEATKLFTRQEILNLLRLKMPGETIDLIGSYLEKGEDPNAYPLTAKMVMAANKSEVQTFAERMHFWGTQGSEGLISNTCYDLVAYLRDNDIEMNTHHLRNLAIVAAQIPKIDLLHSVLDCPTGQRGSDFADQFKKVASKDKCRQVAELLDRHTKAQYAEGR